MTQQHSYGNGETHHTSIGDLFNSMMEFGSATTRFTLDQMQTAFCLMTEPGRAVDRVKHTLDNLSSAINKPSESATNGKTHGEDLTESMNASVQSAAETLSGRKV